MRKILAYGLMGLCLVLVQFAFVVSKISGTIGAYAIVLDESLGRVINVTVDTMSKDYN